MKKNNQPIPILLVDDNEIDIRNLQNGLKANNIEAKFYIAKNGIEALDKLYGKNNEFPLDPAPKVIFLDIDMPKINGMEFLQQLRSDPNYQSLAVFVITGSSPSLNKLVLQKLNVAGYFTKPLNFSQFIPLFNNVLATSTQKKITFLLIEDSKLDRTNTIHMLQESIHAPFQIIEADEAQKALNILKSESIDCILLDYNLPKINGLELLKKIQQTSYQCPVLFLTGSGNEDIAVTAIKEGALDYIVKNTIKPELFANRIMNAIKKSQSEQIIAQQQIQLQHDVYHDSLTTNLLNRRGFEETAINALSDANRHSRLLALLFIDLDNFKNINDSLGHSAGNTVLIELANRLQSVLRKEDIIGRMGGDEFAVLLIGLDDNSYAETAAKKILKAIARPFQIQKNTINVGISIGIAYHSKLSPSLSELLKHADNALFQAKTSGRGMYKIFINDTK